MSWVSVDSPEESPDQSLVYQLETVCPHNNNDLEMTAEAREIVEQVHCMEKDIFSLKNESVIIMNDIENFTRENISLKEKQKSLRKQIKFNSESFLSKLELNEERDEIQELRRKIRELENSLAEVEQKYKSDKKDLTEKNKYNLFKFYSKNIINFFLKKHVEKYVSSYTKSAIAEDFEFIGNS